MNISVLITDNLLSKLNFFVTKVILLPDRKCCGRSVTFSGSAMAEDGDVIVITGGNGFVEQHVIKLLHQHCHKEVKEIRVFDIKPYTQNLGMYM